jgi:hypothetical protein
MAQRRGGHFRKNSGEKGGLGGGGGAGPRAGDRVRVGKGGNRTGEPP